MVESTSATGTAKPYADSKKLVDSEERREIAPVAQLIRDASSLSALREDRCPLKGLGRPRSVYNSPPESWLQNGLWVGKEQRTAVSSCGQDSSPHLPVLL